MVILMAAQMIIFLNKNNYEEKNTEFARIKIDIFTETS